MSIMESRVITETAISFSVLNYDLIGQTGSTLQYLLTGSAPNRTLTVQWSGFTSYGLSDNYNFQIKLLETVDEIQLCNVMDRLLMMQLLKMRGLAFMVHQTPNFFMRTGSTGWANTANGGSSGASIALVANNVYPCIGIDL